ncbi:MFS transporter [Paraburkholderia tropica]|uniref:MFS transporter n=1 Tax=Paraburkholderia tropica TaxID=92647 RepID=UPI002AB5EA52|nr:MFS transporter [Paraburkholderia tropica]
MSTGSAGETAAARRSDTSRLAAIAGEHPLALPRRQAHHHPGGVVALLGIILVSLNLRAAATSVPPILKVIGESFAVTTTAQSLLGTLPLLCFAVFGIVTPRLTRRLGLEKSMVVAAALIALGEFARAGLSQSASGFILLSVLCLGGMGMANVLVPAAVKHYFPDRIGLVSGIFQVLIVVSASVPSLIAVQATAAVGWRLFVGSWGLLGAAAPLPWLALRNAGVEAGPPSQAAPIRLAGSLTAWSVMLVFSTGPMILYALIAWLPALVTDTRGVSAATAATMLSVFNAIGLFHSFVVPNILDRMKYPYLVIVFSALCAIVGALGLAYAAGSAWPWIVIIGLSAMFLNIGLTLVTMRCRTEAGVTAFSSFVQSGGYLIAAIAPLAMGALHTATGGWVAPCWCLAAIGVLALLAGLPATRRIYLDDTPTPKTQARES